jgi:methyl-accepting chemotaxis protein
VLSAVAASIIIVLLIGFMLVRNITLRLGRLTTAIKKLAAEDLDVDIAEAGDADEIGEIAGAVEAFKLKAIEKARLESDGALQRQKAESEAQARVAQERGRAAEEQARVVAVLAEGLQNLAEGNLTFRLTDRFGGAQEQIKVNFNPRCSGCRTRSR